MKTRQGSEEEFISKLLQEVKDPEIPVLSIVDLGIVEKISIENGQLYIGTAAHLQWCPAWTSSDDGP